MCVCVCVCNSKVEGDNKKQAKWFVQCMRFLETLFFIPKGKMDLLLSMCSTVYSGSTILRLLHFNSLHILNRNGSGKVMDKIFALRFGSDYPVLAYSVVTILMNHLERLTGELVTLSL